MTGDDSHGRGGQHAAASTSRRRRLSAGRLASVVVFTLAGLLFATSALTADGADLRAAGRTDLPALIRDREQRVTSLERNVTTLRAELDTAVAGPTSAELDDVRDAVEELAPQAGLTAVTGPALTITLDDSDQAPRDGEVTEGLALDDFIVHQQDLEGVINALWTGGAEAMMIMDQRVISTSSVRCVGNVLSLQGRTYSPPYTVSAIGDVDTMQAALGASETVSIYREYVRELGLGYGAAVEPDTTFPAYDGALSLQYAESAAADGDGLDGDGRGRE